MNPLAGVIVPLPIGKIKRVSPSRFLGLQLCPLKEIWAANNHVPLLPSHPAAKVGTISHAVLEEVSKGKVTDKRLFDSCWNAVKQNIEGEMDRSPIEKHLIPLENSAFNYEVKKILCYKLAEQMFGFVDIHVEAQAPAEQWVESADGKVGGKIDLIINHKDGAEIIDYKTGTVFCDGADSGIKEEYQTQMKLYAALYHEAKKSWPIKLSLIGLDRQKYDVSFTLQECSELLSASVKTLDETNELIEAGISAEDFARPSPKNCKFCLYRPACRKYWQTKELSEEWPVDLLGDVKERLQLGNGLCRLSLNDGNQDYAIRGLSLERHSLLKKDLSLALFCDLGEDTSKGFYVEQLLTTGYSLNNETRKTSDNK